MFRELKFIVAIIIKVRRNDMLHDKCCGSTNIEFNKCNLDDKIKLQKGVFVEWSICM